MNANQQTSQRLTKAEFVALVDAYLGARAHERWARDVGGKEEWGRAVLASEEARKALMKGAGYEP